LKYFAAALKTQLQAVSEAVIKFVNRHYSMCIIQSCKSNGKANVFSCLNIPLNMGGNPRPETTRPRLKKTIESNGTVITCLPIEAQIGIDL
jgi:hypothetical protein